MTIERECPTVWVLAMLKKHFEESIALQEELLSNQLFLGAFDRAVVVLVECFKNGGRLLIAGNGGSAAQAQHLAAEFVGKYEKLERPPYSAIALSVDTSILTAWSNDYSFDLVFARQVEAHARKGDVFLGISTSGNSKNILEALQIAKARGVATVVFLGKDGGKTKGMADIEFIVPSTSTGRIQEVHNTLLHALTDAVEQELQSAG